MASVWVELKSRDHCRLKNDAFIRSTTLYCVVSNKITSFFVSEVNRCSGFGCVSGNCVNLPTGPLCYCDEGFVLLNDSKTCAGKLQSYVN